MPELNISNPSLADVLSRTDPNGNISTIIEVAEKSNPIIQDAVFTQCNDGTSHQQGRTNAALSGADFHPVGTVLANAVKL